MPPVAIDLTQDLPTTPESQKQSLVCSPGPTLVIGSPSTAQDGTYPNLINELEKGFAGVSEVEKQMMDRILMEVGCLSAFHCSGDGRVGYTDPRISHSCFPN